MRRGSMARRLNHRLIYAMHGRFYCDVRHRHGDLSVPPSPVGLSLSF